MKKIVAIKMVTGFIGKNKLTTGPNIKKGSIQSVARLFAYFFEVIFCAKN